jgi:hypothetical protein
MSMNCGFEELQHSRAGELNVVQPTKRKLQIDVSISTRHWSPLPSDRAHEKARKTSGKADQLSIGQKHQATAGAVLRNVRRHHELLVVMRLVLRYA